jgi:DNA-binding NtrC family response regulator
VIKDLGGFVDVKTKLYRGTTFMAYLPLLETMDRSASGDRLEQGELEGDATILVVDDEPIQRDLADALLSSLGYHVVSCDSGRAAIDYLDLHDVDLVILDMIMEEDFDGLSTYRHIVARNPAQRCLIASGFCDSSRVKEALEIGVLGYVSKPYTREEIGQAVRDGLETRLSDVRRGRKGRALAGSV